MLCALFIVAHPACHFLPNMGSGEKISVFSTLRFRAQSTVSFAFSDAERFHSCYYSQNIPKSLPIIVKNAKKKLHKNVDTAPKNKYNTIVGGAFCTFGTDRKAPLYTAKFVNCSRMERFWYILDFLERQSCAGAGKGMYCHVFE